MNNPLASTKGVHIVETDPILAPYGSWPSGITVDDALVPGVGLSEVIADADAVYWLESRPHEDGRQTVMRRRNATVTEVTPGANVRSRVQEYGGGAYDVRGGVVAYCDDTDRTVKLVGPAGTRTIATAEGDVRFGDLRVHPELGIVLAIREDHRGPGEPEISIVALPLSSTTQGIVLARGSDFYSSPELSDTGNLAWVEWHHPNMPWDATEIKVGKLRPDLTLSEVTALPAPTDRSNLHPRWIGDALTVLSDESGYWNPWRYCPDGRRQIVDLPHDFCLAPWQLGNAAYAPLSNGHLLVRWYDEQARLGILSIDGTLMAVTTEELADVNSIASNGDLGYAIVSYPDRPTELIEVSPTGQVTTLVSSGNGPAPQTYSKPRSLLITGEHGVFQAWFYAPRNAGRRAPAGERPPLIVKSHGGPTGLATCEYNPLTQWWTSRGFAVLDVNYSGSAGFGREFRNRLYDSWGIADRDDCVSAVRHVLARGLADPKRIAITGGSAGGYTTLRCLTTSTVFTAGVSRYGIGDMVTLATDTHKFESHYCDYLVGTYPQHHDVYVERSPIAHLDHLSAPMLILQGLDDRVVPAHQATAMAEAVLAKGLPVALKLFPGEGHGFRQLATRRAALEAELSFYSQLFGFTPADRVAVLAIENLPS